MVHSPVSAAASGPHGRQKNAQFVLDVDNSLDRGFFTACATSGIQRGGCGVQRSFKNAIRRERLSHLEEVINRGLLHPHCQFYAVLKYISGLY